MHRRPKANYKTGFYFLTLKIAPSANWQMVQCFYIGANNQISDFVGETPFGPIPFFQIITK
jgi:hypothetical protein